MQRYQVRVSGVPGLAFTYDKLPNASTQFAYEYGLRQFINDGHASVTKKTHPDANLRAAAKRELAEKRDAMLRTAIGLPSTTFDEVYLDPEVVALIEKKRAEALKAATAKATART